MPGPFMLSPRFDELLARAMVEQQTEDRRIHERHAQRISIAAGRCVLYRPEFDLAQWTTIVEESAGPCPCAECERARNRIDSKCEGWSL